MSHYDVALCYTMTLCYLGGEQTTGSDEAKPADDSAAAPAEGEAAPAATEGESQGGQRKGLSPRLPYNDI